MSAVSIHALLAECDRILLDATARSISFNPRTPCGVRRNLQRLQKSTIWFQSTHSLRSATVGLVFSLPGEPVSIHALLAECDAFIAPEIDGAIMFQSTHSLRSATRKVMPLLKQFGKFQSTHSLRSATISRVSLHTIPCCFNPRTPCGVRLFTGLNYADYNWFQSTHSLRSATAPDLIHGYSTEQIILCANLPKKTVIARLLFLSIYLSIFYSQCITPIADLPGNSCELEVGAQAMFNSL